MRAMVFAVGMLTATAAHAVTYTSGNYTYIAPSTGVYTIITQGGQGGNAFNYAGGLGAIATADFNLTAGDQISISVGNAGVQNGTSGSGGTGSFVYVTATNLLLEAAGGGGGATTAASRGGDASVTSTALVVTAGNVNGVNGDAGFCCGAKSHPGAGGQSFINSSVASGYVGGSTLQLATAGGAGRVTVTEPAATAVPEPVSLIMLGLGGVGAVAVTRRRKAI